MQAAVLRFSQVMIDLIHYLIWFLFETYWFFSVKEIIMR